MARPTRTPSRTSLYEIGKRHPFSELRAWFGCLYQVLLGQPEGPRFGGFIALYRRAGDEIQADRGRTVASRGRRLTAMLAQRRTRLRGKGCRCGSYRQSLVSCC